MIGAMQSGTCVSCAQFKAFQWYIGFPFGEFQELKVYLRIEDGVGFACLKGSRFGDSDSQAARFGPLVCMKVSLE